MLLKKTNEFPNRRRIKLCGENSKKNKKKIRKETSGIQSQWFTRILRPSPASLSLQMANPAGDFRSNRAAVQATNDDASASKLYSLSILLIYVDFYLEILNFYVINDFRSCVKKSYMKDDYIHLFVRRPVRRSPIINRGLFSFLWVIMLNWAFNSDYVFAFCCLCFVIEFFVLWKKIFKIRLFCSLGCTAEAHVPVSWCCAKCWWEGYCKETNPVSGSWFWHYIFSVEGALISCLVQFTFYVYIFTSYSWYKDGKCWPWSLW